MGQDRAGCHAVHPDALVGVVERGDLGQADDPGLAVISVRGQILAGDAD